MKVDGNYKSVVMEVAILRHTFTLMDKLAHSHLRKLTYVRAYSLSIWAPASEYLISQLTCLHQ